MSDCTHAMVQQVTIDSVDDVTVTFTTRSASKSGDPDESLRRTFRCPRAEVWTTPIDGAPPPVELTPGAVGNLFLSRAGWEATSEDGHQIFGTGTEVAVFKWPWCAAPPRILSQLAVIPTSIVVRGHLAGDRALFDLELICDGDGAAARQHVRWNGTDYLSIALTQAHRQRLGLASGEDPARIWPTQIIVTGSPMLDRTIAGEVDVLDCELAGPLQELTVAPGEPVTLSLTPDGVAAFHLVPQLVLRAPAGRTVLPVTASS